MDIVEYLPCIGFITPIIIGVFIIRNTLKKRKEALENFWPGDTCPNCGREYSPSNRVQFDPISGAQMCDICYNDLMNRRIMFEILF